MKVIIWALEEDVIGNNIKRYFLTKPKHSGKWIQVILTVDELVQIDDKIKFGQDQINMLSMDDPDME
tara:strand:- start:115 stop:315 length:201 start_codon:yes stop_codon:yes gene_type:complete